MLSQKVTLINKLGLHARASMKLVSLAERYSSEILIKFNNREINAKSIMNMMVLAAANGSELTLNINGSDENEALKAILDLINNRFGEDE